MFRVVDGLACLHTCIKDLDQNINKQDLIFIYDSIPARELNEETHREKAEASDCFNLCPSSVT